MSELLSTIQSWYQQALVTVKDISSRAPGSHTTQALVVGALLGLVTYQLMKKRYRLPPGPRPLPLLGNLLSMKSTEEAFYIKLSRWAKEKYGPVITVYFGPQPCVTLNSVDVVREALVEKGVDFAGRPFLHSMDLITDGSKDIAFATYSPAWKLHRKIALQAMRHYMSGQFLEKVAHSAMIMVFDRMAAEPGPFDPHHYNTALVYQIINTICFGADSKPYDDPENQRVMIIFDAFMEEFGNGFLEDVIPLLKYWPTKRFKRVMSYNDELNVFTLKLLKYHRETFSPDNIRDLTDSILLAQKEAESEESAEVMAMFTDAHVVQIIGDVFSAGLDTSRLTLDWFVLFMAGHPEIQKRAQAEIDAATGNRMPGLKDRSKLQFTEAVLYEAMRLGTVAPTSVPHTTIRDSSVGGYDVPEGTMVLVNLWAVMHDPDRWDEPEEFRPERFLDKDGKLKKLDDWMPFSVGRRACLGESIAKPELVLLVASLLKRFFISLPEGAVYDLSYNADTISSCNPNPYKIVITSRH